MARGWESKSVEDQQMDADRARRIGSRDAGGAGSVEPAGTPERAALMLARARALADLQLACAPAHRAMLEQAIRDLESRIGALG